MPCWERDAMLRKKKFCVLPSPRSRSRTPTWRQFKGASMIWRTDAIGRLLTSMSSFVNEIRLRTTHESGRGDYRKSGARNASRLQLVGGSSLQTPSGSMVRGLGQSHRRLVGESLKPYPVQTKRSLRLSDSP